MNLIYLILQAVLVVLITIIIFNFLQDIFLFGIPFEIYFDINMIMDLLWYILAILYLFITRILLPFLVAIYLRKIRASLHKRYSN